MKLRRATSKKHARQVMKTGKQWLLCSKCQGAEMEVLGDVSSVICSDCVQRMVPPPEQKTIKAHLDSNGEKFPRGWHLKKRFVASDGTVYERGKKVGESTGSDTKSVSGKRNKVTGGSRKRGRPPKSAKSSAGKRGRPPKLTKLVSKSKGRRGRPPKRRK